MSASLSSLIFIPYPEFDTASTADEALAVADRLNFPILVRPSYVLGGQGMKIVINKEDLVKQCYFHGPFLVQI